MVDEKSKKEKEKSQVDKQLMLDIVREINLDRLSPYQRRGKCNEIAETYND